MTPKARLESFIRKFTPAVAADALAIGFAPSERASDAVLSIAVFPRWVTLCFLQCGPKLTDPKRLLKGSGSRVRSIPLTSAADLDTAPIRALIAEALDRAHVPIDASARRRLIIKSVSAKQRPRRPS
jgi:hypothetical protein